MKIWDKLQLSSSPPFDKKGKSFQYIFILLKIVISCYQSLADMFRLVLFNRLEEAVSVLSL